MYEVFRRMCFNVFYKNLDDHGKNFSFLYSEELKGYKLSPAYDLTSTPNKLEHEMTVNGNGNPNKKDMLALAQQFNLSLDICNKIIDEIQNIIKQENIYLSKNPKFNILIILKIAVFGMIKFLLKKELNFELNSFY